MVKTDLFAQTYKSYGLTTVGYPVLEVTATVEPFENGRGFSLRVLRAGKPRTEQRTGGRSGFGQMEVPKGKALREPFYAE